MGVIHQPPMRGLNFTRHEQRSREDDSSSLGGAAAPGAADEAGRRPTIKHVAQRAGVGVGTVSRVLNGAPAVSEATRQRVEEALRDLGYARSSVGRSLKTGATDNVGVAIMSRHAPVILNPFYAEVLGGIEEELNRASQHLLLSSLMRRSDLLALASEGRVDGLLLVGCDISSDDLARLTADARRVVLIDNEFEGLSSVSIDHRGGARLAAMHLLQRGCRRPAFVAENLENPNFRARLDGFREALAEHGVEVLATGIAAGGDSWDGGYHAMRRVLAAGHVPDAVFAANDPAALSAMRALSEAGLRVPEDVKVVGFDDIHLAAQSRPALTTVRVQKQELGRLGAKQLLEQLGAPGQPEPRVAVLPCTLVERASA